MKSSYKAAAKINLMLDILSRLDNGYHSLFMVMQSVSLFDRVEVVKTSGGGIKLLSNEKRIPCDETNIAHKAATAFFDYIGEKDRNISVYIEKNIPFAAGILQENDVEFAAAKAMAVQLVWERAFYPIDEKKVREAKKIMDSCSKCICAVEQFGPLNEANRQLAEYAKGLQFL